MISELQVKDIIAIEDGSKLGYIHDLEIDTEKGSILALVIALKGKWLGLFGKQEELVIPWNNIVTIGKDVILVKSVRPKLTHSKEENPDSSQQ